MKKVFVASFAHSTDCFLFVSRLGYKEDVDSIYILGIDGHSKTIFFDSLLFRYYVTWKAVNRRFVYYVEKVRF